MSRYDAVCELIAEQMTKDSRGVVQASQTRREVFCNVFSLGDETFYSAVAAGIHPDARIQIRKADYEEERLVDFEGTVYYVSRVNRTSPDYVVLTLTERIGDR